MLGLFSSVFEFSSLAASPKTVLDRLSMEVESWPRLALFIFSSLEYSFSEPVSNLCFFSELRFSKWQAAVDFLFIKNFTGEFLNTAVNPLMDLFPIFPRGEATRTVVFFSEESWLLCVMSPGLIGLLK